MQPTREKSLGLLRKTLERLHDVKRLVQYSVEHQKWEHSARRAITFVFGKESQQLKDFDSALKPYSDESETYKVGKADVFKKVSPKVAALLEIMIEEVEDYWDEDARPLKTNDPVENSSRSPQGKNVFIIHGHDTGTKEEVARFISKLGLNPIILHEQANQGKTVIEKFEQHADVSFAIALLTPDDVGASNTDRDHLRSRPRQNVLFEFGYFIGKLGRRFVCGLIKGDVEIPSDYSGVLYIHFDTFGAWRLNLVKELRAAGLEVDVNAVF